MEALVVVISGLPLKSKYLKLQEKSTLILKNYVNVTSIIEYAVLRHRCWLQ